MSPVFCLYLLHFWLDIVCLSMSEGEQPLRLEGAVYEICMTCQPWCQRVNLPILTSIAVCHTHQHFWWAMSLQCMWRKTVYMLTETRRNAVYLSNEHTLSISTLALLKVGEMFLSYRSTMYFIFLRICKSNRSVLQTTYWKAFATFFSFYNFEKLPQIQTFILPDFSHHLSQIVIIRFLCFSLLRNKLDYEQITT